MAAGVHPVWNLLARLAAADGGFDCDALYL
jgi:p-aminobenzoyl-glutamate transporter AbgT